MDAEIERLLKKRQNGFLTDDEKIRLQELIDTRHAIEVKYNLTPADTDGFATIEKKVEAAVARAQAMGKSDADMSVYQDAIVATAEGMAAINAELAAQYEQEYAVIQLIEDAGERQVALDELNARYMPTAAPPLWNTRKRSPMWSRRYGIRKAFSRPRTMWATCLRCCANTASPPNPISPPSSRK